MTQIEKNKAELWEDIQELANMPLNAARASQLVDLMGVYDTLCRVARTEEGGGALAVAGAGEAPRFDRKMADEWAKSMRNADGTKGPHWTIEKTRELQKQYGINCDEIEFWAVVNSIYSDYCEVLKKNNVSALEVYACMAKAWIEDGDAVPNKAAAYFTYVVKH